MNKITEHKSVYSSCFETETVEFNSTEDLIKIDFVRGYSQHPEFRRYSIKRDAHIRIPLLAEYRNGKWMVVGFLEGDVNSINLPDWQPASVEAATAQV